MRTLSDKLLAAQKEATRTPFVKLEARNKIAGVVRYDWSRLYTGSEDDYFHAVTMPGDGSLTRVRITPPHRFQETLPAAGGHPWPGLRFQPVGLYQPV
jgi:hypothetical protein